MNTRCPLLPERGAPSDVIVKFAEVYLDGAVRCRPRNAAGPLVGVVYPSGGEWFHATLYDCLALVELVSAGGSDAVPRWYISTPSRAAYPSPERAAAAARWSIVPC